MSQTPTPVETASGRYNSEITGGDGASGPTSTSDAQQQGCPPPNPHNTTLEEPSHNNNNNDNNINNAPTNNNNNNNQGAIYDNSHDIGVEHVNWLVETCQIELKSPILSLRECSSSFFAILYQRLFNCNIPNLELEPNTQEKRLWNMKCVLTELQAVVGTSLDYISAEEIVSRNETHIKKLIAVFYEIVVYFAEQQRQQQQLLQQQQEQQQQQYLGDQQQPQQQEHPQHLAAGVMENADELSNVDSAYKTQQLVASWKRGIIPPQRSLGRHNNNANNNNKINNVRGNRRQEELRDLHNRTMNLRNTLYRNSHRECMAAVVPLNGKGKNNNNNKTRASSATARGNRQHQQTHTTNNTGRSRSAPRTRTTPAALLPACTPPNTLTMPRMIDTEARDNKIEQLRLHRLLSEAQQQVRAAIVRNASQQHTALVAEARQQQTIIKRNSREMRKWVKEEDDKYKEAYRCLVLNGCSDERSLAAAAAAATRGYLNNNNKYNNLYGNGLDSLVDPQTAQLYLLNKTALRTARTHLQHTLSKIEQLEEGRLLRYRGAVTGWRAGTISTTA